MHRWNRGLSLVWAQLVPDGLGSLEAETLAPLPDHWDGEPDHYYDGGAWLHEEISALDWKFFLGIPWREGLEWAMEHGIAPYQPFLIWIEPPIYSRDYWGETDVDPGEWDILAITPLSAEEILENWAEVFEDAQHPKAWRPLGIRVLDGGSVTCSTERHQTLREKDNVLCMRCNTRLVSEEELRQRMAADGYELA